MIASRFSLLGLVAALAAASPADAAPLDGAALRSSLPGSEIRANFLGPRGMEDHVWRLQPDGTVTAVFTRAPHPNDRGALEYGGGIGRWTVHGGQLCVQMQGVFAGQQACFVVDLGPGNRVTLTGGNPTPILRGTLDRLGSANPPLSPVIESIQRLTPTR